MPLSLSPLVTLLCVVTIMKIPLSWCDKTIKKHKILCLCSHWGFVSDVNSERKLLNCARLRYSMWNWIFLYFPHDLSMTTTNADEIELKLLLCGAFIKSTISMLCFFSLSLDTLEILFLRERTSAIKNRFHLHEIPHAITIDRCCCCFYCV